MDRPATVAEFVLWIETHLAELEREPDRGLLGSGIFQFPIAGPVTGTEPPFVEVSLYAPDPLHETRECLFDSIEKFLDPTRAADFWQRFPSTAEWTVRRLRLAMRYCLELLAEITKSPLFGLPQNSDVTELCRLLADPRNANKSNIQVARDFLAETYKDPKKREAKARSLNRQARAFSRLWKPRPKVES